ARESFRVGGGRRGGPARQSDRAVLSPPGLVASSAGGQATRRSTAVLEHAGLRKRVPGLPQEWPRRRWSEGLDRRKRPEAIHAARGSRGLHGRSAHRQHVGAEVGGYWLLRCFLEIR